MDQPRYWIQKDTSSHVFGDSWEEQAFAEDAAGPLGGCIWPPRSYTCTFCRREFRSAQALGGHMNVHRRDRARLKQIPSPKTTQLLQPNTSSTLQNPNDISNPNFDLDHPLIFSSPSPTVSILRPFTCSFAQEPQQNTPTLLSWPKFEPRKRFHITTDLGNQEKGCTKVVESNSITPKKSSHEIEVHFTGSLIRRRCESDPDDDEGLILKRRRTDTDDDALPIPKNSKMVYGESMVPLERSPNSTLENLDLELRLGDRPGIN